MSRTAAQRLPVGSYEDRRFGILFDDERLDLFDFLERGWRRIDSHHALYGDLLLDHLTVRTGARLDDRFRHGLPPRTEMIHGVIQHFCRLFADAAAEAGLVEHAMNIFPRFCHFDAPDVVNDRCGAIFPFKRSANERPERRRNRGSIHHRTGRRRPAAILRVDVMKLLTERHIASVVVPGRNDLALEAAKIGRFRHLGGLASDRQRETANP
jgi:hypothetical protein